MMPTPPPPPEPTGDTEADAKARAAWWMEHVYQGDKQPQLTVRAVVVGMLIGGAMSLSNLYVGMKTGWGLGVTITSCILAFAFFSTIQAIFPAQRAKPFGVLENNMMASAASSAGYMSSSIFVAAIPALYLATGQTLSWLPLALWAAAVSFLGVFMAIPMKKQQIDMEQLPFPSGLATAETLKAMHSEGEEAKSKARSLGLAGLIGAVIGWLREAPAKFLGHSIPEQFTSTALTIGGQPLQRLTIGFEPSTIMLGAGAIIGTRVAVSMMISAIVCYAIVAPQVINAGWCDPNKFRQTWALWPGVGFLVASGLTAFATRWRTIARAFSGIGAMLAGKKAEDDPTASVDAPQHWFVFGVGLFGAICTFLGWFYFGISIWMGILAVLMTFVLSLIASRATGETDITPTGAMGKITQLTYGAIAPGNMTTNLMTASLTGGAAIHCADLLTDLKSGYVLGANPRRQLIAQLFGVVAGTAIVVPAYLLLIPPDQIGSDAWPAPAAQIWAGVAKVLAQGLHALPQGATTAMLIGLGLGMVNALAEDFAPLHIKKRYIPSSTAVGLAWVIPAMNSLSMFAGAMIALALDRFAPSFSKRYTLAIASGLIAGESLIAVVAKAVSILTGAE